MSFSFVSFLPLPEQPQHVQGSVHTVPDQKQDDPALPGQALQVLRPQGPYDHRILQIMRELALFFAVWLRVGWTEIAADGRCDDHKKKPVVKPGQEGIPVPAGLDPVPDRSHAVEHILVIALIMRG